MTESVAENNRPALSSPLGVEVEIRVKTCGKSARVGEVTRRRDKPCELKCHVHRGSRLLDRCFAPIPELVEGLGESTTKGRQLEADCKISRR